MQADLGLRLRSKVIRFGKHQRTLETRHTFSLINSNQPTVPKREAYSSDPDHTGSDKTQQSNQTIRQSVL